MIPPPLNARRGKEAGFSLVEIAIAIGILAVALVALIGLMPAGMANFRKAMDTSVTAQIAQRLMHDMEEAEFSSLVDLPQLPSDPTGYCPPNFSFRAPTVQNPTIRYFDDQGAEVIPQGPTPSALENQQIVYHANIRIIPRAVMPTINETGSQVAQITVQIARNPGNRPIPITSGSDSNVAARNLFKTTTGVAIFTYSACVGNNQGK